MNERSFILSAIASRVQGPQNGWSGLPRRAEQVTPAMGGAIENDLAELEVLAADLVAALLANIEHGNNLHIVPRVSRRARTQRIG